MKVKESVLHFYLKSTLSCCRAASCGSNNPVVLHAGNKSIVVQDIKIYILLNNIYLHQQGINSESIRYNN